MNEQAVVFANGRDEKLVGVYHQSSQNQSSQTPRAAIVMLHGWSGTRCGPHQMLTRAAREFCHRNYSVLRFDFAGRGDSDGDGDLATLATMREDAIAALSFMRSQCNSPLIVLGLCSGCEIVVASAANADLEVSGAILWSAPVFAALPSNARAAKKRGANFKKYARKLLSLATYTKILRGQIDTKSVSKALSGGGGGASKNIESNAPGQLPPGFRRACLDEWLQFKQPRLQIYGSADPITEESMDFYRSHSGAPPQFSLVTGANHSFYGLEWERQVFQITLDWLEKLDFKA